MADNPQLRLRQETRQTPPAPLSPDLEKWIRIAAEQRALSPNDPSVSPDLVKWLREASRDVRDTEETNSEAGPTEDFPLETAGFEACEFQLANGNNVKVVFAKFWERIRYEDWREGARPAQYYAIKVYSTEDILPRKMAIHCEFRGGKDFAFIAVPKLWYWLEDLVKSRRFAEFDSLAEFIDELAEEMNHLSDAGEDAVEHVQHLPEIADTEAFDHEDDSIYNDQNEPNSPIESCD